MGRLWPPLYIRFSPLLRMGQLSLGPCWEQRNAMFIHALAAYAKSCKLLGLYNSFAQKQIRLLHNTAALNWQAVFSPPPLLIMLITLFSGIGLARFVQKLLTLPTTNSASTNSQEPDTCQTTHQISSTLNPWSDALVSMMNLMLKSEWTFLSA